MTHNKLLLACLLFFSVTTAFSQKKIILAPYTTSVEDATIGSIDPDGNYGSESYWGPYSWTQGGIVNDVRSLIRFGFDPIPANAKIQEALLVLYFDPFSPTLQPGHTGNNSFSVRRITGPWEEMSVTWNNQPPTTSQDEVIVPTSDFGFQNYVVNITDLVQDMRNDSINGNQGFMVQLLDEEPYSLSIFASKESADVSRHIQLWVTYKDDQATGTHDAYQVSQSTYSTSPNPASNQVTILANDYDNSTTHTVVIYNNSGAVVLSQNLTGSLTFLNTSRLPAGMYALSINENGRSVYSGKLEIVR